MPSLGTIRPRVHRPGTVDVPVSELGGGRRPQAAAARPPHGRRLRQAAAAAATAAVTAAASPRRPPPRPPLLRGGSRFRMAAAAGGRRLGRRRTPPPAARPPHSRRLIGGAAAACPTLGRGLNHFRGHFFRPGHTCFGLRDRGGRMEQFQRRAAVRRLGGRLGGKRGIGPLKKMQLARVKFH